ncbi:hypothetical protein ZEAMMB73_Zm00001d036312 [Zea mays]|uniref:Ubiquitin-like protease family profile domain-containing protein n=1 Tax=Zea mays TaxID=4577 RepID=A0A1D6LLR1_MAIZE|nr:hypothetical protein ZEAMMB73_Zm00001d036312 [Zea mays]
MAQICSAERRVLLYLDHDMVFILINIREMHWYLVVINAINMEIQVLDSLGTSQDRKDLTDFEKIGCYITIFRPEQEKGCPLYNYEKEVDTRSPSDVEILDNPTNPKKRKLLHVLDDSEVVFEDEEGPITQADLQRWFVADWDKRTPIKVSTDGCTNDFLMGGLSTRDMLVTKADLIDVLCDYIMAIQDDTTLECYDMAVRLLANKESRRTKGEIINNINHYMDMRFWRMVGFGKLPKYHQDPTTEELAKTLDWWPSMNYYITGCRYVLMPWKFNECYTFFVIDHVKKHKLNTSYLVLQAMTMWGNDRQMEFIRDAKILRKNFVIDLLSYEDNSCRYVIPANI